ncbi:MAG: ABC transporter ATP-binding protein [Spirochaetes bacterium]|nr:ABC transporter ATP-binding protein [Spirochaetota bacterium]
MQTIEITDINHYFLKDNKENLQVLDSISLKIEAGDFVVILGESGCGKTTFLNMLAGFSKPDQGSIIIDGEKVDSPHPSRSIIFQKPVLLPWLNVSDNIAFGCKIRDDIKNLEQRVYEFVKIMGLTGFEKARPNTLSLGMAQRVCIARSLIGNPEVLLLDEPFTALDYYNRTNMQLELIKLWKKLKFTAIFVTHDIQEAIMLGKKIVIFSKRPARIVQTIDIDFDPPHSMDNPDMFQLKMDIQKKLIKTHPY